MHLEWQRTSSAVFVVFALKGSLWSAHRGSQWEITYFPAVWAAEYVTKYGCSSSRTNITWPCENVFRRVPFGQGRLPFPRNLTWSSVTVKKSFSKPPSTEVAGAKTLQRRGGRRREVANELWLLPRLSSGRVTCVQTRPPDFTLTSGWCILSSG